MSETDSARQQPLPLREYVTGVAEPPVTSRGVTPPSQLHSESHLDWLTVRTEYPEFPDDRRGIQLPVPRHLFREDGEIAGIPHYRQGLQLAPAGKLFWNPAEHEKGALLSLSGDELHEVRSHNQVEDDELLDLILRRALAVTRLDFCITIDGGNPRDLIQEVSHGKGYYRALLLILT